MLDQNSPTIGRFDKSFLIHMIRDFFFVLVIVSAVEFSLKAALVYYNYSTRGAANAEVVANNRANNVRSIMRNEGPVVARVNGTVVGIAIRGQQSGAGLR